MGEKQFAKYYAIIVDSTPDSFHVEQTTFPLRYLVRQESRFEIVERFLKFVYCSDETESKIAQMTTEALESHAILLADCRAQGYDNAANMSGKYNGAQAITKEQYPTAIFSSCAWHTLNLCGNDGAECIPEASTGTQTIRAGHRKFKLNSATANSAKLQEVFRNRKSASLR